MSHHKGILTLMGPLHFLEPKRGVDSKGIGNVKEGLILLLAGSSSEDCIGVFKKRFVSKKTVSNTAPKTAVVIPALARHTSGLVCVSGGQPGSSESIESYWLKGLFQSCVFHRLAGVFTGCREQRAGHTNVLLP